MTILMWLIAIVFAILLIALFFVSIVALGLAALIGSIPAPLVALASFLIVRRILERRKDRT